MYTYLRLCLCRRFGLRAGRRDGNRHCSLYIYSSIYPSIHASVCCGAVFPVSVVGGAAVPAVVCRWELCSCCPGVGRCGG